jgi:heme-degrading monooxygenase HmoA
MINRMTVPSDYRERFERMFQTRARAVDRRPGFISAEILRPTHGDDYLVVTHWESREHFNTWIGSEEYREGHARVGEFKGPDGRIVLTSKVEEYEVLAT